MEEAKRLAGTREGQALIRLLREQDSAAVKKAMADAAAGNMEAAGKTLSSLLASPEARQLIQQLGGRYGGF